MLGQEGYVEIHVMFRQGMSIKAIGRELGISRTTVRKYLRAAQVPTASPRKHPYRRTWISTDKTSAPKRCACGKRLGRPFHLQLPAKSEQSALP